MTPLDWGLGHATRCIPIINELLSRGCEVQIATSGRALILLKQEFPRLKFHELVSYNAHYSNVFPLTISLLFQVPKILSRIKKEHRQTEEIVRAEKIHFVISDNRYGCWSERAPSIFVTHQINILMPWAWRGLTPLINHFNHRLIEKFKLCWVPDGLRDRITGKLTESKELKVSYIGMISRFEKIKSVEIKYDLLVLLSGPEPQRTLMERQVLKKLKDSPLKVILVRGIPGEEISKAAYENIILTNHLNAKDLNEVIEESRIVVSRSGYSTIMDLAKLNKKAILIPTPGQTEQVYLANQLSERKIAYSSELTELNIDKAIASSSRYSGFTEEYKDDLLVKAIDELLE